MPKHLGMVQKQSEMILLLPDTVPKRMEIEALPLVIMQKLKVLRPEQVDDVHLPRYFHFIRWIIINRFKGDGSVANGDHTKAIGIKSIATGFRSHAQGSNAAATGHSASAHGENAL